MQATHTDSSALTAVKEHVRQEWSNDATVVGWRDWQEPFAQGSAGVSNLFVPAGEIVSGMRVLDLASGSGEPAITIATAIAPRGHVTATDLSPGMLKTAEDRAAKQGCKNMSFTPADMEALPFENASFDRVTSRFGIMFPPDTPKALREILRVLKPAGKVIFVVWTAPEQPFFTAVQVLRKMGVLPAPVPGAPSPLRFAAKDSLSAAMREAGFHNVQESVRHVPWNWPGSAENFYEFFHDISAPYRPLIDALDPERREALVREVLEALRPYEDGNVTRVGAQVVLAVGERASA